MPDVGGLRARAEAALALGDARWEPYFTSHGDPYVIQAGEARRWAQTRVAQVSVDPDDYGRARTEFIAGADPRTVIELLDRLGAADALCQAWEDEMAFNDGADIERPDIEEARTAWLRSR